MQRKLLTILFACLFVWTARADQEAKGDSIYEQMVEWSLTGKRKEMLANEERALRFFYDNSQWEHYYYISTLCNANKVLEKGLVMSSLRDCRKLYQFARDNKHDYGRGIALAQIGWLYGFMGDHEESVRQMEEAFRIFRHHPLNRDVIGLLYYYAYNLELTGRYDEEARVLAIMKPMIQHNAPIGLFPDMEYQGETIDDIKGKPLFIYTDGLNEAEDLELQQFGEDRLLGILQQTPFSSPRHLIDQMTRQVELHRNGAEPNDDLTMLCLCCYA